MNIDEKIRLAVVCFDSEKEKVEEDLLKAACFSLIQKLRADFIDKDCKVCDGNWVRIYFSGMKKRWPDFYENLADDMYELFDVVMMTDKLLLMDYIKEHFQN